jgi:hypothetical protein
LNNDKEKKASRTHKTSTARKTNQLAFYAPLEHCQKFPLGKKIMSALGYEGYLCAMGQIRGRDTRQGDSLIIFKPAIHNFPSVFNTNKTQRTEVVIRSEKEYCKLFLEITIGELSNACDKANEKAAANKKAGD